MIKLRDAGATSTADVALLGDALATAGEWTQAIECYRHVAANAGADTSLAWSLIPALLQQPSAVRPEAARAMQAWGRLFVPSVPSGVEPAKSVPLTDRKLRLGIVSSHWENGGPFELLAPLLLAMPQKSVSLYVYADGTRFGVSARKLRAMATSWQELREQDDETAALIMRNDALDALIDLDGPLRRRRCGLLARHPCPLMISLLDLPEAAAACGFDTVLGDSDAYPVNDAANLPILRVPGIAATLPPDISLIALSEHTTVPRANIAFGTTAHRGTITQDTVSLWGEILGKIPGASFVISEHRMGETEAVRSLSEMLGVLGLADRIVVHPKSGAPNSYFDGLDILLEPPGASEYLDAIAAAVAGLPVITSPGTTPASRVLGGWLQRLGFSQLYAKDHAAYVNAAVSIAKPAALRFLRNGIMAAVQRESASAGSRASALEAVLRRAAKADHET